MVNADEQVTSRGGDVVVQPDELLTRVRAELQHQDDHQRLIVGIAGAPASGKSSLAQWLVDNLNADAPPQQQAVVVPMDGYHLDNSILDECHLRDVKGAPHTFDAFGFCLLVKRLHQPIGTSASVDAYDPSNTIYIPVFDRTMDLARCAGDAVELHHRIIVLEGNYLLLQRPVWCDIAQHLHLSVFLDVPESVLTQRLIQRWLDHGLSADDAEKRALGNDIPNAHVVTRESTTAHLIYKGMQ